MNLENLLARVDIQTGLIGHAEELPQGGWKLIPLNEQNSGRIVFLRDEADLRPLDDSDLVYGATITFHAEGELYGEVTIHLVADDDVDAEKRARKLAESSVYDDERIPDRSLEIDHALDDDMKDEIIGQYLYGATGAAP